ncbi:hypothetical protein PPACK8108_LOCUS16631 [Phakopsora pachyrhizi]|uniref:Uncharacterized protein n=1 Tax=Phakopsora pachyrhizi TaxID=170000 RepID=A0AAV0BAR4_PHAPC|nr:hypothetical protein PPACK8108_LOCUS16631 [Phakopsora pachyrhizi]
MLQHWLKPRTKSALALPTQLSKVLPVPQVAVQGDSQPQKKLDRIKILQSCQEAPNPNPNQLFLHNPPRAAQRI